jgi:hypothetical protein
MAKAYEISVWKIHPGKRADAMKNFHEVAEIFESEGVSKIKFLEGHAGKDVGHVVMIQTFKGLADNGAVNEKITTSKKMGDWMKKHSDDNFATLVSHDLYVEAE